MFTELGAQDASIQLQEVATSYLEQAAAAGGAKAKFLRALYAQHGVPHGTHSFAQMRETAYGSYLLITYALFEKMIKGCIKEYKIKNRPSIWVTKNNKKRLPPLLELVGNMPAAQRAILASPPEYRLLEYYRLVRVSNTHVSQQTLRKARSAYAALTTSDLGHISQYEYIAVAPNPPGAITFEDFKLYTRSIKYYSNLLNEVCA